MFGGCAIAVSTEDAMYLTNPFDELLRFKTFETDPAFSYLRDAGAFQILSQRRSNLSHLLGDDEWLLVTKPSRFDPPKTPRQPLIWVGGMSSDLSH